jgi:hypothetical protein
MPRFASREEYEAWKAAQGAPSPGPPSSAPSPGPAAPVERAAYRPTPIAPEAGPHLGKDLVVTACGLVTCGLTALILALVEEQWDVALYTFSLWFVIPVGALIAGFVGATGYYAGAKLFDHKPGTLLLVNIVVASVATFFLIHYLEYATMEINGVALRERVPFLEYLDVMIRSTSMSVRAGRSSSVTNTGELGGWGYIPAILQVLGFAIGGFCVYAWLAGEAYCDACARYLTGGAKQTRFTGDADGFTAFMGRLGSLFEAGDFQGAIAEHRGFGTVKGDKEDHLRSTIEIRKCKACPTSWMHFTVEKKEGREWKNISELGFATFVRAPLRITA